MTELWIAVGLGAVNALLLVLLLRRPSGQDDAVALALQQSLQSLHEKLERVERELRTEIAESSRGGRQELTQNLTLFQQSQVQQLTLELEKQLETVKRGRFEHRKQQINRVFDDYRQWVHDTLTTCALPSCEFSRARVSLMSPTSFTRSVASVAIRWASSPARQTPH